MPEVLCRSVLEPLRTGLADAELWGGADAGLIAVWERGREHALERPELAAACLRDELPVLPWKGGVDRPIRAQKFGCLHYVAMWQGLRNQDLYVDPGAEVVLRCSRTGVSVIFTPVAAKYVTAG